MSRIVVLAGGSPHAHDFASTGAALVELLDEHGHEVELVDDPDRAAIAVGAGADVLVVDGLWWRMLGEVYDEWRDAHAYSPPDATRAALADFVHAGGGVVAMHTAVICFDDWPGWGEMLGGAWQWGDSAHPPQGPVSARIVAEHPVVDGVPAVIELDDEVYGDLLVDDNIEVLAVAQRDADDADQPVVWTHRFGAGRVVVNGFGHDAASIRDANMARLVSQSVAWVTEAA